MTIREIADQAMKDVGIVAGHDYTAITIREVACHAIELMDKNCEWEPVGDGDWRTTCNWHFTFTEGGPAENGFEFCPHCGGMLTIQNEADS